MILNKLNFIPPSSVGLRSKNESKKAKSKLTVAILIVQQQVKIYDQEWMMKVARVVCEREKRMKAEIVMDSCEYEFCINGIV